MYSEVTSVYVPVKTPDYPFWAIILSVLVHVVLLALVIFFHHTAPPPPMQTTLVTPEQLAAVEGQIKANQQNSAITSSEGGQAPSAITPISDMFAKVAKPAHQVDTPSPTQTLNQYLAAKQAQWEKEQALFAEKLDQEIEAERQGVIEQLNSQSEAEQKNLRDYKAAARSVDDISSELRATAAAYNKNLSPRNTKNDSPSPTDTPSLDLARDGKGSGKGQSQSQAGGAGGANASNYVGQVTAIIDSHWNVPANSSGKSLIASFSIAADGTISNIVIRGGGDEAFKASLMQAISQSSPLPAPPTGARTMTGNFKAD